MRSANKIFKQYIKGTPEKAIVPNLTLCICELTRLVMKTDLFSNHKVYITTKVLKHLYDSKPAEEFECIIKYIEIIIRYPEQIYKNKPGKRGGICFAKIVKGSTYICSVEITEESDPEDGNKGTNYLVTSFRIRDESYLKNYELLWSWKGDVPSS